MNDLRKHITWFVCGDMVVESDLRSDSLAVTYKIKIATLDLLRSGIDSDETLEDLRSLLNDALDTWAEKYADPRVVTEKMAQDRMAANQKRYEEARHWREDKS